MGGGSVMVRGGITMEKLVIIGGSILQQSAFNIQLPYTESELIQFSVYSAVTTTFGSRRLYCKVRTCSNPENKLFGISKEDLTSSTNPQMHFPEKYEIIYGQMAER